MFKNRVSNVSKFWLVLADFKFLSWTKKIMSQVELSYGSSKVGLESSLKNAPSKIISPIVRVHRVSNYVKQEVSYCACKYPSPLPRMYLTQNFSLTATKLYCYMCYSTEVLRGQSNKLIHTVFNSNFCQIKKLWAFFNNTFFSIIE